MPVLLERHLTWIGALAMGVLPGVNLQDGGQKYGA